METMDQPTEFTATTTTTEDGHGRGGGASGSAAVHYISKLERKGPFKEDYQVMPALEDALPLNPDGSEQECKRKLAVRSPTKGATVASKPQSSPNPVPPKKSKQKKKKVHYRDAQLPDALADVTSIQDFADLETVMRSDPKAKLSDDGDDVLEVVEVAYRLKGIELEKQTVSQLKKLCSLVGATGFSKCNKFQLLRLLAATKPNGSDVTVASSADCADSKVPDNTKLAIINTVLCTSFRHDFLSLNQWHAGGDSNHTNHNNNENFQVFANITDYVNDEDNDNVIGTLIDFPVIDKERHIAAFRGMGYDPTKRLCVTADSCRCMLKSILRGWIILQNKLDKSGTCVIAVICNVATNVNLVE